MTKTAVIVGAGPAGAAVAWQLTRTGYKVICLEQGDYSDVSGFPAGSVDWELKKLKEFNVSPNTRKLPADYPIDDSESPIAVANFNGVGGSMVLYSAHFPRFHPSDFKTKSLDGVGEDWPFSYEDLIEYFDLNDAIMGVSGLEGDPAYPPLKNLMPPVPLGKLGVTIAKGFNKLGWHWWPAYSAIITKSRPNRLACNNCGPCNTGCVRKSKSSPENTYWPEAISAGAELRVNSRVSRIFHDENGLVSGVTYFDSEGKTQNLNADVVILAANGIGTPRILLNSESASYPNGLANSSDQVGRNLMFHPYGYVDGVFDEIIDSFEGPQGCVLLSQEFYETDQSRDFDRGYTLQVLRGGGPVETALAGINRGLIPWGDGHLDAFVKRFRYTANMVVITEDLPDPENRVTLHESLTDQHGIPAPKIHYAMGGNTKRMMAHGLNRAREVMVAAGAEKTSAFGPVRYAGWHLMGTARMGADPTKSVVNGWGQSHDIPNLFIADSSIFPTSGGVNPAPTQQAVALRVGEGVVRYLQGVES